MILSAMLIMGLLFGVDIPTSSHASQDTRSKIQGTSPQTPQGVCQGFTDVPAHEYFCLSLISLTTRGAVSGYSTSPPCTTGTPCFRPYENVSRQQFSKMLVVYFQWPINTSGGPHFTDVLPGSTFYDYIETAYNRQIMTGYTTSPPCTTGVPCFMPGNSVTRGQMAKMVSNAAGFNDSVTGRTPSYYDVPSGDPFFVYVERLVMHNVVNQYPPGASPQPSCGSATLPCFFLGNSALRADTVIHLATGWARMVGNTQQGSFNNGQVLPYKGGPYPTYDGVWVYMTTPDPTTYNGQWQAGPVGVGDRYNGHYIESGPQKKCDPFCNIHPYGTWNDGGTGHGYYWDTNTNLAGGSTYAYKSLYFGGTGGQWQSQFCSSGCQGLVTSGDLGFRLPYVIAGGESNDMSVRFGSLTASAAQASINGVWNFWCYNPALTPFRTLDGKTNGNTTPGACSNYGWTVTY